VMQCKAVQSEGVVKLGLPTSHITFQSAGGVASAGSDVQGHMCRVISAG